MVDDVFKIKKRQKGEDTFIVTLAKKHDVRSINTIRKMLVDLIKRCRGNGRALVLPYGGGNLGKWAMVQIKQVSHLISHVEYLDGIIGNGKPRKRRRAL